MINLVLYFQILDDTKRNISIHFSSKNNLQIFFDKSNVKKSLKLKFNTEINLLENSLN